MPIININKRFNASPTSAGYGVATQSGSWQTYPITQAGYYTIEIVGASGGFYGSSSCRGGYGGKGTFVGHLNAGETLCILVGRHGYSPSGSSGTVAGGGGGATCVFVKGSGRSGYSIPSHGAVQLFGAMGGGGGYRANAASIGWYNPPQSYFMASKINGGVWGSTLGGSSYARNTSCHHGATLTAAGRNGGVPAICSGVGGAQTAFGGGASPGGYCGGGGGLGGEGYPDYTGGEGCGAGGYWDQYIGDLQNYDAINANPALGYNAVSSPTHGYVNIVKVYTGPTDNGDGTWRNEAGELLLPIYWRGTETVEPEIYTFIKIRNGQEHIATMFNNGYLCPNGTQPIKKVLTLAGYAKKDDASWGQHFEGNRVPIDKDRGQIMWWGRHA